MDFVHIRFKELRQKLEYGTTPDPRASTIAHICKTLNVSADWLLGLEE